MPIPLCMDQRPLLLPLDRWQLVHLGARDLFRGGCFEDVEDFRGVLYIDIYIMCKE
jgi:hypothetical protein